MIFIACGANLPSPHYGAPDQTIAAAYDALEAYEELSIVARSSFWWSAPVPISDQPWYCNSVISVETSFSPAQLLARLHETEEQFGRVRSQRNAARILDLDLIAYHDDIVREDMSVPHPRMHERAFVLKPLQEIAPNWRHPVLKVDLGTLIEALPEQHIQNFAPVQAA